MVGDQTGDEVFSGQDTGAQNSQGKLFNPCIWETCDGLIMVAWTRKLALYCKTVICLGGS